jgi:putative sterol carrier protein
MNDHSVAQPEPDYAMADAPMTPKQYFEEKIAKKLVDKPETSKAVNSIYEFNITGDNGGVWTVDLTKEPGVVTAGSGGTAKCTVTCSSPDFMNIVSGKMNPQMAFMSGKLKIKGDMGLAMKLQKVIG